jgi:hypothetical protein
MINNLGLLPVLELNHESICFKRNHWNGLRLAFFWRPKPGRSGER